jgi:hypothetical protein
MSCVLCPNRLGGCYSSRKSPEAEAVKEFCPDAAPDVLQGMLQGEIMVVASDEMAKEIENDFKSLVDPAILNHRIFAICIASAKSQKEEFAFDLLPYYG